ncbi:MAG: hypothetical protein CM1200mP20_05990 [Pseudomonadota bacterium]|nr:MAG: hypothetical protein CM1200mP20_05990 [Pseudomonadota bacterium]
MRNFNEPVATDAVIERMAQSKDPRFLQVISSGSGICTELFGMLSRPWTSGSAPSSF